MNQKVRLFYSYAHEDSDLRDLLERHLAALQRDGLIESWNDHDILPGAAWDDAIGEHLEQAGVILLLISVHFLSSPYCTGKEMRRALDRQKCGDAIVIPILLRAADLTNAPFAHLQFLPAKGKPVVEWRNRDEAFVDIAHGIRRAIEALQGKRLQPESGSSSQINDEAEPAERDRVLDAAMARKVPMGKPSDFDVMVRLVNSPGLRAVLEVEDEYTSRPEDVRAKPFRMEFPVDQFGKPAAATLTLKLDAPDFEPKSQSKKLTVPPDRDSEVCTFLVTPLFSGELMLNLEVYAGEGRQTSRVFKIVAEQSDRVVRGRVLVSVPISTLASKPDNAVSKKLDRVWQPRVGEFTQMFGSSPAAQAPPTPPTLNAPAPDATGSFPPPRPVTPTALAWKKRSFAQPLASAAAVLAISGASLYYAVGLNPRRNAVNTPINTAIDNVAATAAPPSPHLTVLRGGASPAPTASTWETAYNQGVTAMQSGRTAEAEEQFKLAQAADPRQSKPAAALAAASLARAGQLSGGEKELALTQSTEAARNAIALDPKSAESYVVEGIALQQAGKLPQAEAALRKAAELDPARANAWYALGSVLLQNHKDDEAAAALDKAVALNPNDSDARLMLAAALSKKSPQVAKGHLAILMKDKQVSARQLDAVTNLSKVIN